MSLNDRLGLNGFERLSVSSDLQWTLEEKPDPCTQKMQISWDLLAGRTLYWHFSELMNINEARDISWSQLNHAEHIPTLTSQESFSLSRICQIIILEKW